MFERPSAYGSCTLKPGVGVAIFWLMYDRKWPTALVAMPFG